MNVRALILLSAVSLGVQAEDADRIYMDETVISGNQELPKVLYILPWREHEGQPVPAQVPALDPEIIIAPVYPDEYRFKESLRRKDPWKPST